MLRCHWLWHNELNRGTGPSNHTAPLGQAAVTLGWALGYLTLCDLPNMRWQMRWRRKPPDNSVSYMLHVLYRGGLARALLENELSLCSFFTNCTTTIPSTMDIPGPCHSAQNYFIH